MINPTEKKVETDKPIFGKSGAGRPVQSPTGEKKSKNINIPFTPSEIEEVEAFMQREGYEVKTSFCRSIILKHIRG